MSHSNTTKVRKAAINDKTVKVVEQVRIYTSRRELRRTYLRWLTSLDFCGIDAAAAVGHYGNPFRRQVTVTPLYIQADSTRTIMRHANHKTK